jgi:hypothetical protein
MLQQLDAYILKNVMDVHPGKTESDGNGIN